MKYFGGLVLLGWAALTFTGYEPFAGHERGTVPADVRRSPGGILMWHSGFHGGK